MPVFVSSVRRCTTALPWARRAWRRRCALLLARCRLRATCLTVGALRGRRAVAPLELDHSAHHIGRALGRLYERKGPAGLPRGHVGAPNEHPRGHATALDGEPLLVRLAPPLRGVAGEDALSGAVARHAGADAERVRRVLRIADVDRRPERAVVRGVRSIRARGRRGEAAYGALPRVGRELRIVGHDHAGRELRGGVRTGRKPETGSSGRRRKEGCGARNQDRGGGKSWHYAWYIGPTWASLERGRLEFVMNTTLARS